MGAVAFEIVPLLAGGLAIGHRPPLRSLAQMRRRGVTHIATVLSRPENPEAIAAAAASAGLQWIWIELGSTKSLPKRGKPEIKGALRTLETELSAGAVIFLHCSAGIHRTGMIAAALLFHLGRDGAAVRETLARLRPVTALGVGEERLGWAASFAKNPTEQSEQAF